jgi:hypothetical protein
MTDAANTTRLVVAALLVVGGFEPVLDGNAGPDVGPVVLGAMLAIPPRWSPFRWFGEWLDRRASQPRPQPPAPDREER